MELRDVEALVLLSYEGHPSSDAEDYARARRVVSVEQAALIATERPPEGSAECAVRDVRSAYLEGLHREVALAEDVLIRSTMKGSL